METATSVPAKTEGAAALRASASKANFFKRIFRGNADQLIE